MRYVWTTLLAIVLATALLACQASNPSTLAPQPAVDETDAPGSLPESNTTPDLTSPVPQEDPEMTAVTPPDEASEKMVLLVKQYLAQRLSIAVDQIVLSEIKPVVWRDAGLGCPKPGVDYMQVETPGYTILLEAGGKTYRFHTDETKRFVPCAK